MAQAEGSPAYGGLKSAGNLKGPKASRGRGHKALLLTRTLEPCPAFRGVEPSWFKDQRHCQGYGPLAGQEGEGPTLNLLNDAGFESRLLEITGSDGSLMDLAIWSDRQGDRYLTQDSRMFLQEIVVTVLNLLQVALPLLFLGQVLFRRTVPRPGYGFEVNENDARFFRGPF
jgi:hypothetical protein